MKMLVDKLPDDPKSCPEHRLTQDPKRPSDDCTINGCAHTLDRSFECRIGEKDFRCPYYREFSAVAKRYHYEGNATVGVTRIHVSLED